MIQYFDRITGQLRREQVYGAKSLALLYGRRLHSKILYRTLLPLLTRSHVFSWLYGLFQKTACSRSKIQPFIKEFGIDASEFEEAEFRSFNDFFIRKLKPSCRPIVEETNRLAMPADGRYFVYPKFERFLVKGAEFFLETFLHDPILQQRFMHGSMVIARLCPVDYHRFHFPCSGIASTPHLINGPLYSVNPIALKRRLKILSENKRVITLLETEEFGTILYVEIGATAVGTIRQTFTPETRVEKGQEKGYFEFGGSCLVLLFEKDKVCFDEDLIQNTQNGYETLCRFGSSLGIKAIINHTNPS